MFCSLFSQLEFHCITSTFGDKSHRTLEVLRLFSKHGSRFFSGSGRIKFPERDGSEIGISNGRREWTDGVAEWYAVRSVCIIHEMIFS